MKRRRAAAWSADGARTTIHRFQRAAPWEDPGDFVKRSPITHIKNVTTPMMFIEGEAGLRTPPNDTALCMPPMSTSTTAARASPLSRSSLNAASPWS